MYKKSIFGGVIMETTKLTLRPSKEVALLARQMATEDNISITQLFTVLIMSRKRLQEKHDNIPIGPLTRSVTGILNLPDNWDYKKDLEDILDEKHEIQHENLP